MATNIQASELASTITDWLTQYNEEATKVAKEVVDEMTEQVMEETKSHISWNDKVYSKNFAIKKSFEDKRNKRNTWYVKPPYYRLTHLLEFGHATRNGGRTKAYPHVRYGQEILNEQFEKLMKEKLEQCKI